MDRRSPEGAKNAGAQARGTEALRVRTGGEKVGGMLKAPLSAPAAPALYRFTVEEWHKLGEVGFFNAGDRVELMDGEIILMSPIGIRHAGALNALIKLFNKQDRDRYEVSPGNPFEADRYSEPQPDVMLVPVGWEKKKRHPYGPEIFLLVEISDTSLPYDRGRKLQKYARARVPEYWVVNLEDDCIEVFRAPRGRAYREHVVVQKGSVCPAAFPDVLVPLAKVIPPRP